VLRRVLWGNVGIGAAALGVMGIVLFIHSGRAYMGGFIAQQSSGNFYHPSLHKGGFPFENVLLLEQPSFGGGGSEGGVALCNDTFREICRVCIVVVKLDELGLILLRMAYSVSFIEAVEDLIPSFCATGAA